MLRNKRIRLSALSSAVADFCEPLEIRRLLSTINWTNKGTVASPIDNFDAFGANETVARNIVQRAIDDWERVIVDFNQSGGGNTYNVTFSITDLGPGTRGGTGSITYDALTKPTSAVIQIDDNGGGSGWYFDSVVGSSTVPDDSEFDSLDNPFQSSGGPAGFDLYRTAVHELGHAMGLASSATRLSSIDVDIGDDPNDGGGARLFTVNVDGIAGADYTYTNAGGFHLWEGLAGGAPIGSEPTFPGRLMNSGRTAATGRRQLIDDDIAKLLRDAFDYTVTLPSTINTFYANLNTTTNVVTVTGDANYNGNLNDVIDIELTGVNTGDLRVEANGTSEIIANAQYSSIVVNALEGGDDIDIDEIESGKTVTVNGGNGNDRVDIARGGGDIDTNLGSNCVANGGAGTDTIQFHDTADALGGDDYTVTTTSLTKNASVINRVITYGTMESIIISGSDQPSTYDVNSLADNLTINAGAGNDTITTGGTSGDIDSLVNGNVVVNGGGGTDEMVYNDVADDASVDDTYTITNSLFSKSSTTETYSHTAVESLLLTAGLADNLINVTLAVSGLPTTINGGDGNDTLDVGGAGNDVDNAVVSPLVWRGQAGTDLLDLTDTGDSADAEDYTLGVSSFSKTSAVFASLDFATTEQFNLIGNAGNNTINFERVTSTQTATISGGLGNDLIQNSFQDINSNVTGPMTVTGGGGTDTLSLNDSGDATASGYTITGSTFQVSAGILSAVITYSDIDAFNFVANDQPTDIAVQAALASVAYTLNAGDGNDTFTFGAGDFDNNIDSTVTVNGGLGTDRVRIDDTLDTVDDTYNLNGGSFAKNTGTGAVNWSAGILGGVNIEQFVLDASEANNTINVNGLGGSLIQPFPNPPIDDPIDAVLNGNGGADSFFVTTGGTISALNGNVTINGGVGVDTLTLNDTADAGNDSYTLTGGAFSKTDWAYTLSALAEDNLVLQANEGTGAINITNPNALVTVRGGGGVDSVSVEGSFAGNATTVDGGAGLDNVSVNSDNAGTTPVRFINSQDLNLLLIGTGGLVSQNAGKLLLDTQTTTINGRLDLSDGGFIDRAAAAEATYRPRLVTGYAAGAWTTVAQPAIFSTAAAGGSGLDALGYGFAGQVGAVSFFGSAVAAGDFLIRYTLYGDADLSGSVDLDDFTRLAAQFGLAGNWSQGNFNYDAMVNLDDFTALAAGFGLSVPADLPRSASSGESAQSLFSQLPIVSEGPVEEFSAEGLAEVIA